MNNGKLDRNYRLKFSDFNCHDIIAPYAVLDFFQDIAGEHADYIGVGFKDMVAKGYYWVLVRTKYEVIDDLKEYSDVIVSTWPHVRGKIDFDREYLISDINGKPMIKGISKWVVIDANTRRLSPCRDLQYNCEIYPHSNFEGSFPKIDDFDVDGYEEYEGTTEYIDVDHNGHVNNISYARFISNAIKFSKDEQIKSFEIDYIKEMKINAEYKLFFKKENKTIKVKGFIKETNELSFVSLITLK